MREVWLVSEGSPGHDAQSMGLAEGLSLQYPGLVTKRIQLNRRLCGVKRMLARKLMGVRGRSLACWLQPFFFRVHPETPVPEGRPDLVISSGGQSVLLAYHLARIADAPYVFIGERKPYPSSWFHTVFTPSPLELGVNDVAIDLIPTPVSPEKVQMAAEQYNCPEGRLWAMIIGGQSRSHRYSEDDWVSLADGMNLQTRKHGIRWLLTTSRRTGEQAEAILKQRLDADVLADAVWWSKAPRKVMLAFLGTAERAFVTQDSVSMVSECVSSNIPTVVLRPSRAYFPSESFLPAYFTRLADHKYIDMMYFGELGKYALPDFTKLERKPMQSSSLSMVDSLLRRIG